MSRRRHPEVDRMINAIGARLDGERARQQVPKTRLARRCGLSDQGLRNVLSGQREARLSTLLHVAGALNLRLRVSVVSNGEGDACQP